MQTWVCTQASRNVPMGVPVCVYPSLPITHTLPRSPSSRKAALGSGNYTGQQAPLWKWSLATFIWTFLHPQLSPICSNVFTSSSLKLVNCLPLYLIPGAWFGANSPICWDLWIPVLSCQCCWQLLCSASCRAEACTSGKTTASLTCFWAENGWLWACPKANGDDLLWIPFNLDKAFKFQNICPPIKEGFAVPFSLVIKLITVWKTKTFSKADAACLSVPAVLPGFMQWVSRESPSPPAATHRATPVLVLRQCSCSLWHLHSETSNELRMLMDGPCHQPEGRHPQHGIPRGVRP